MNNWGGGGGGGGHVRRGNKILSKVSPQSRFVVFVVWWMWRAFDEDLQIETSCIVLMIPCCDLLQYLLSHDYIMLVLMSSPNARYYNAQTMHVHAKIPRGKHFSGVQF